MLRSGRMARGALAATSGSSVGARTDEAKGATAGMAVGTQLAVTW